MRRNLTEKLSLHLWQYQVIPIGYRLNALGQVVQPWASLYAAGIPQQGAKLIMLRRGHRAPVMDDGERFPVYSQHLNAGGANS